jgi:zona occludens toxin
MAIILVTGLPGHGKTLWTLAKYKQVHEAPPVGQARPVFHASGQADRDKRDQVNGIPGLVLPWEPFDPRNWDGLPPGALGIIDEAQFVFPIRQGRSEPPEFIAKLATHRHLGVDLVLITQHPKLLDPFVLRLVDQHFHVRRKFGTKWASILEFPGGVREYPEKSNKDAVRHEWRYPKAVFDLYKSAEVHTVKARLPMRVYVMMAVPLVFLGLAGVAYTRLNPDAQADRVRAAAGQPAASVPASESEEGGVMRVPSPRGREPGAQWVSDFAPRVAGLPHTAPAFDHLTVPVEAPYPAYCVSLGDPYPCKCYSQRGTVLEVPKPTCESVAKGGFFAYWAKERERAPSQAREASKPAEERREPVAVAGAASGAGG